MRLMLFDWTAGGHHPVYLRRAAQALSERAELVAAVPGETAGAVSDLGVEVHDLGAARPSEDLSLPRAPQSRALAERELALLRDAVARARPDHLLHLYSDPILRALVREPALGTPVTLTVFFARRHYPRRFESPMAPAERARAEFHHRLLRRWRRRPDAHALFLLDPVAAEAWGSPRGVAAHWFPEPPLEAAPAPAEERRGCAVYGALSRHKGIDRLAAALEHEANDVEVTLAGVVDPAYAAELDAALRRMRAAGARVDLRPRLHDEAEGLAVLGAARCAVLAYPRHLGMSRVLLEACAAGTPVVADRFGLLGHLVREHGLGLAVDSGDPDALLGAIRALTEDEDAPARYAPALSAFAERFSPARFRAALAAPFPFAERESSPARELAA